MFDLTAFTPVLRDFVAHPLLFASVSGAHLYGFDSPDSDVDLRGCHILPVTDFIGLDEPRLTLDRMALVDGVEVDLVSHDLKKYVTLLIRQNGNYLEQLFSPLMVVDSPQAAELRHLVRQGNIARHVYHAYAAYAKGKHQEWRADALKGEGRLKPLLYAYRVSLTGVHLLRTGEVNANLAELAPVYGYVHLLDLIAAKSAERIAVALPVDEHDQALSALQEELRAAYETSPLPDEPQNRAALNDFVVRVRLELGAA
jgi:predicted nucleotidyltransferase